MQSQQRPIGIRALAKLLSHQAAEERKTIIAFFGATLVIVKPGDHAITIVESYFALDTSIQKRSGVEILPTFALKNEKLWLQEAIKGRQSPSSYIFCYTARWAHAMESEMANGQKLDDIVERTGEETQFDCLTPQDLDAALCLLFQVWEHGDQLRRWCDEIDLPSSTAR